MPAGEETPEIFTSTEPFSLFWYAKYTLEALIPSTLKVVYSDSADAERYYPYEAADLAKEAEVGEMWLTHYSPSLARPEEYMDAVRAIFPNAKAGKDGMTVELDFPEN